jgi:hypothetical protein
MSRSSRLPQPFYPPLCRTTRRLLTREVIGRGGRASMQNTLRLRTCYGTGASVVLIGTLVTVQNVIHATGESNHRQVSSHTAPSGGCRHSRRCGRHTKSGHRCVSGIRLNLRTPRPAILSAGEIGSTPTPESVGQFTAFLAASAPDPLNSRWPVQTFHRAHEPSLLPVPPRRGVWEPHPRHRARRPASATTSPDRRRSPAPAGSSRRRQHLSGRSMAGEAELDLENSIPSLPDGQVRAYNIEQMLVSVTRRHRVTLTRPTCFPVVPPV